MSKRQATKAKRTAKQKAGAKGGAKATTKAKAKTTAKGAAKAGAKSRAKGRAAKARSAKARTGAKLEAVVPVHTAAEKRAIVERYIAAYNARDTAAIVALYAPRAAMSDPVGLPPAVGHAAIAGLYKMGFDMNVSIAPDGAVRCAGNAVAFPLVASSPTSRLHVIDVFDFGPDGKIVEMRAYWGPDNLEGDLAVRQ
jgi:steroid Delta-isomerase